MKGYAKGMSQKSVASRQVFLYVMFQPGTKFYTLITHNPEKMGFIVQVLPIQP